MVEDHKTMLHIKFQSSKHSGSEDEDFEKISLFLWFEPRTPGAGPSCTQDLHLNKLSKRPLGNATYHISSI